MSGLPVRCTQTGAARYVFRGASLAVLVLLSACGTTSSPGSNIPTPSQGSGARSESLADTYVKLGIGYLQQGKRDLALSNLQRALELDDSSSSAHNAIAILYEQLGEIKLARRHYERAVRLNPQDSPAQNNYGAFLCRQNEMQKAEQHFLEALKNPLYETPEFAYENAGLCALQVPDRAKAERYFREALRANPTLPESLYQMALLSYEAQNYLSARAYLQRHAEAAQHTPRSLWLGIRIERELGDKNALASYSLLLKGKFPGSEEAGLLLQETGKTR
ncbi:MAG: type IV pilus biogenesis/stability protein PilW [Gammaproteobacteria bacterium]|nr:MAG: type IV pilus biogenesis/stability protein PilW [Gammaproteobacteria bacterium]